MAHGGPLLFYGEAVLTQLLRKIPSLDCSLDAAPQMDFAEQLLFVHPYRVVLSSYEESSSIRGQPAG